MDNYRGLIQDMSPQDREVTISFVYHFDPDTFNALSTTFWIVSNNELGYILKFV